ncbi:hypothetical protein X777_14007 [Ooceraea biroi]|uniref:Uncharacterized protein n=1 Tax=Ooceraea biroi TaxID=2015173 RepID=A0A026WYD6_OOCBI|nr:hypothetical protein X777_14007 [Ooceraea biroi]
MTIMEGMRGRSKKKGGSRRNKEHLARTTARARLDSREKRRAEILARCDSAWPLTASRYREPGNYRRARELTMLPTVEVCAAYEARRLAVAR